MGFALTSDFKSVARVIMEDMSQEDRNRLASNVRQIFDDLDIADMYTLLPFILNNSGIFVVLYPV